MAPVLMEQCSLNTRYIHCCVKRVQYKAVNGKNILKANEYAALCLQIVIYMYLFFIFILIENKFVILGYWK